ncbi:protein-L-isoaspartate O-methyltransferase 1-like isoform X1 [Dendrobium catenatum]|uniref:protein-L-isoaspartate O-methyltransferase 1-like isoform X1 n=2 Tax=Dendrobium catenatum TaxID=906689 RepID=UPI0009F50BF3|nr:protein-L-isoaspartate O-methyltransferase 1-like isoform X1 [Dendrobium catenatum]
MHCVALGSRFRIPLWNPVRKKAFTVAKLFYSSSSYHCAPSSVKLLSLLSDVRPLTTMEGCKRTKRLTSCSWLGSIRARSCLFDKNFWTSGSVDKNKRMVESLQRYGIIKSKKVSEVMEKIDRGLFVQSDTPAYVDSPMQIGYNATISAPHMHATCLELLKEHLQPGMRALDVGSGTGYLTACFAIMVGSQGCAVGVEHIPELASFSIENIKKSSASSLFEGSLWVHVTDGRLGWAELAPYDAIHVGAAAPEIPNALIEQLKPGGRMVIPVGTILQDLKVIDKKLDGSLSIRTETSVRYVPLTSKDAQLRG